MGKEKRPEWLQRAYEHTAQDVAVEVMWRNPQIPYEWALEKAMAAVEIGGHDLERLPDEIISGWTPKGA